MSDQRTDRRSSRSTHLACLVAVVVAATVTGAVAGGTATTATGAGTEVALDVGTATVERNGTGTVPVRLDRVPAGLAGFELTLVLGTDDGVTVTGASYPDAFQPTTTPDVGPDGQRVRLKAADVGDSVTPGARDVTLATLTVTGAVGGTTDVTVEDAQVDADDGTRIDPAVEPGRLVVGTAGSDASVTTGTVATGGPGRRTTGGSGPGFGLIVGLVGLAAVGRLARRA